MCYSMIVIDKLRLDIGKGKMQMTEKRRARTIVVDDESHIRLLMATLLESMICDVVAQAGDGEECVLAYKENRPDLLLLDINMPVKTGKQALQEIMAYDPDAFVIMLTSVTDTESIIECLDLGAKNYIRKDTPLPEIQKLIKETWMNEFNSGN